jgi:hypothetical protein
MKSTDMGELVGAVDERVSKFVFSPLLTDVNITATPQLVNSDPLSGIGGNWKNSGA